MTCSFVWLCILFTCTRDLSLLALRTYINNNTDIIINTKIIKMTEPKRVLFVCLGNICRSPIAEGVFLHLVKERGLTDKWQADSAATGAWHTGSLPDSRAMDTMKKHNIPYNNTARQVHTGDFLEYDFIFGMDKHNIRDLKEIAKEVANPKAKILLLGEMCPEDDATVRDPYYDNGAKGFEECYQKCLKCCTAFLDTYA